MSTVDFKITTCRVLAVSFDEIILNIFATFEFECGTFQDFNIDAFGHCVVFKYCEWN